MTSPKSLKNNFGYAYRTGLRDNAVVAVIQFLIGAAMFIYTPATMLFKKMSRDQSTGGMVAFKAKEVYQYVLSANMEYLRYLLIGAFLGIGILMGIMTFKFMVGKKTMNVYYSLGIKRTHLFTAKYLSGLTLIAGAIFLPLLISVVMNIMVVGVSSHLLVAALYYFLGLFSLTAVAYSLTAMVFSAVGTAFEGTVFSGILILLPTIILGSLQTLIEKLVLGTPYGTYFSMSGYRSSQISLLSEYKNVNPLMYLSEGLYQYMSANPKGQISDYNTGETIAWALPNFAIVAVWLLIAGAFFAAATYIYEHRKAEIGGFIGKNKFLNFICTFAVGFYGFVCVFSIANLSSVPKMFIGLAVFAVIYVVLDLLLIRNLREFAKGLYKLPIHLGISVLVFVFFFSGYFGSAYKVPELSEIQSAQISAVNNNYAFDIGEPGNNLYVGPSNLVGCRLPSGVYETQADLEKIAAIQKALVDNGEVTLKEYTENVNEAYPMYVKIIYNLKNGKQVMRAFYGINEEVLNMVLDLEKTDYRSARLREVFFGSYTTEYNLEELQKNFNNGNSAAMNDFYFNQYKRALQADDSMVKLYNKALDGKLLQLTPEQRKALLNCLYEDISAMTAQQLYNPAVTYGALSFAAPDVDIYGAGSHYEYMTEAIGKDMDENGNEIVSEHEGYTLLENSSTGRDHYAPNFFLTPEMEKTIGFLKSIGVYDDVVNQMPEIKELVVTGLTSDHTFADFYFQYRYEVGKEFIVQSAMNNGYQYKVTDPEIIRQIYDVAVMRQIVNPQDGYMVNLIDDQKSCQLYVDGTKLPASLRSQIDASGMQYPDGSYRYYG